MMLQLVAFLAAVQMTIAQGQVLEESIDAFAEYEAQVATRDPLEAIAVLDSLTNHVLWSLDGYVLRWSATEQRVDVFLDGVPVEGVSTGIDEVGRQVFEVPMPDAAPITGWIDVDVPHNRLVMGAASISRVAGLTDNDDGTRSVVTIADRTCDCTKPGGKIIGFCAKNEYCTNNLGCNVQNTEGQCIFHDVPDCGANSIQPAPLAMMCLPFIGGHWRKKKRRSRAV